MTAMHLTIISAKYCTLLLCVRDVKVFGHGTVFDGPLLLTSPVVFYC